MRIVYTLIIFVLSCGKQATVPEGIIPPNEMTQIFWDLMIADELVAYRYPSDLSLRMDSATSLYTQVATAHKITHDQLKRSLEFYEGRPDLLQVIFDSLNKRSTAPLITKKDSARVK